ncbi:MAG: TetR/AcrR family transcriptional regulator [Candidatus Limnocylindria bacterium]
MQSVKPSPRSYRSPVRRARALETRRAIVDAAATQFAEQGYVMTSVDAIAAGAGVGRATVFAIFGTKPALLKAAYDAAFGGGDERTPLIQRPEAQRVLAERDPPRYLAAYVALIAGIFAHVAPIHEVVRAAAHADPEVAAVWERIGTERLNGSRRIVGHLEERGGVRPGLDPARAADLIWVLNDPGMYFLLVHQRGWSTAAYEGHLADLLIRELL